MNFHGNGLNLKQRLLYTLNLMIFTQVQNFAARWQQLEVLTVASIVRNQINLLGQLINHNIYVLICLHVGNIKAQNYLLQQQRNHKKSIKAKL